MTVDENSEHRHMYESRHYRFCSRGCWDKFTAAPEDYVEAVDPVCGMSADRDRHL